MTIPTDLIILDEALHKASINSNNGIKPQDRPIDEYIKFGIIILDKHAGPTSHEVVAIVKEILNLEKAGHSGTLDPNVTGVLPIALANATKVLGSLLKAPKEYICNMQITTEIPKELWKQHFMEFTGEIYQVPPLKSNVVKKLRKRRIYGMELLEIHNKQVLFRVRCEAGTYIRTLCEDLGRASGSRAFMKELRRVRTGPFDEKAIITLHQLFDAVEDYKDGLGEEVLRKIIRPVEEVVAHLPVIILKENAIDPICHGSDLAIPGILAYTPFTPDQMVSLLSPKGELVAIGTALVASSTIELSSRGKIAHPNRVIMPRGFYKE
ncbi:MAG: RNA-guided pseudouridylation complex pseudouridine synthase subunit Cbf5 [Candidatus Kariarchaeaceae archaeon]